RGHKRKQQKTIGHGQMRSSEYKYGRSERSGNVGLKECGESTSVFEKKKKKKKKKKIKNFFFQFHPTGIVFDFMRYPSDTAFFQYQLSDLQR
ncbi:hypothetical protein, partial [Escherichia coli]|uniref:hypothetical protein n=1 Tax=Escherichia coli TaxID=562 RepID=UPI001C60827B